MSDFTDIVSEYIQKTDCKGFTKVCYKPAVTQLDFMCMTCGYVSTHTFCEICVQEYIMPGRTVRASNDNHEGECKNAPVMLVHQESIMPFTA